MAKDKKSVLLYCDLIHTVEELKDADAGKLFKHYLRYINDQNPTPPNNLVKIVFEPIKQNLKRDLKKWEKKSERNSEIAKAGWEKRKDANACERIKPDAKNADKDTVTDTDTVKDIIKENKISITQYFIDFVNGSQIVEMARLRKLDLNFLQIKVQEFKQHCRPEYNDYKDFVFHFGNWLNKPTQQQVVISSPKIKIGNR